MDASDDNLAFLPDCEQVSRGRELLQLLGAEPQLAGPASALKNFEGAKRIDEDWNVVVKQTFIEVVIPPSQRTIKRSMSDSALPRFQPDGEKPWKSIVPGKLQDMSDASTNVSFEAEELDANGVGSPPRDDACWSSDDEMDMNMQVGMDTLMPGTLPYPFLEQWWMPMGFDANSGAFLCDSSAMLDPAFMPMEWAEQGGATSQEWPMEWAEQGMAATEGHSAATDEEWRTTVMIRNMPNNYTRDMLLELVDSMGFSGTYDFVYLPIDFQTEVGLGYAFVNFVSLAEAQRCFERFEGFNDWDVPSEKVCTVTWSSPTQGFEAHIERYQNSPVMHHSLPDEWKPVLFQHGVRVPFPEPTKPIKTPKVRQHPSVKNAQS